MVNIIGTAAQQISSNLSKLKENPAPEVKNSASENMQEGANSSLGSSQTAANSANLGSRISNGLIKLQKASDGAQSEKTEAATARNGVEVVMSKEAKAILKAS